MHQHIGNISPFVWGGPAVLNQGLSLSNWSQNKYEGLSCQMIYREERRKKVSLIHPYLSLDFELSFFLFIKEYWSLEENQLLVTLLTSGNSSSKNKNSVIIW